MFSYQRLWDFVSPNENDSPQRGLRNPLMTPKLWNTIFTRVSKKVVTVYDVHLWFHLNINMLKPSRREVIRDCGHTRLHAHLRI